MKILVFGNIGSGKTTVANRLKDKYPFEIISIDDYRRKFSDCSKEGEIIARDSFYRDAGKEKENQIIKCLGVGDVADRLYELLFDIKEPIICLILVVSKTLFPHRL